MLQVVFHARIGEEQGAFSLNDVADGICKKLILRHPHVFGNVKADTAEEVLNNWDAIKRDEKSQKTYSDTLESVPKAFPALMRAAKVQKRAAKAGFDWDNAGDALKKIPEELFEFQEAVASGNRKDIEEEFGDLLFAAVNVSRFYNIDAEASLAAATDKFMSRFKAVEKKVIESDRDMKQLSLEELDAIWDQVKASKIN